MRLFLTAAILAAPATALAQAPELAPAPAPEVKHVLAFGRDNPDCLEWTDECVVCKRRGEETACSTPGVACLAREPRCTRARP